MSSLPPPHPMPPVASDDSRLTRSMMGYGAAGMVFGPTLPWHTPDDPVRLGLDTSAGRFLVFFAVPAAVLAFLHLKGRDHVAITALGALVGLVSCGYAFVQIMDVMTVGPPVHGENAAGKGLYLFQLSAGWFAVGACIGLARRTARRDVRVQ